MPEKPRNARKPRYVLIIEDNTHHAELLTEILDRHFSPVIIHTVDTVEDGIDFVSQSAYDIILTDAVIMDLPVTRFIPKLSALSGGTPLIVISGRGDEKLAAEMIKQGATEYLTKTRETLDALPNMLRKHLDHKRNSGRQRKKPINRRIGRPVPPTPSEIIHEVDRLTQQALLIAGPASRKRPHTADDMEQLDRLLSQIKKLREMASKLLV